MNGITIYEFDRLIAERKDPSGSDGLHAIPVVVFEWLEGLCLKASGEGTAPWLRLTQRLGRRAVQVTSFVGVIRAPTGFQIEVLPKVGRAMGGGAVEARKLLIDMLSCLKGFRHIQTDSAKLAATRMPLLEIFIREYLRTVEGIVKRGIRSKYSTMQDNHFALRGKLLIAPHLRQNQFRADRFYTEYDEYATDRPENRLIHSALRYVLRISASQSNQQLARELDFAFAEVPVSDQVRLDFQRVQLDRGMGFYADALAWASLILAEVSPLTGKGGNAAPSLLFPMEAVFEAFVARHLPMQLTFPLTLKTQVRTHHLVNHCGQDWFKLKPDMVISHSGRNVLVLDTKWKLLDEMKTTGTDKYGLSQADFYQLHAYGHSYLDGVGDLVLVYPKTAAFYRPLSVFKFLNTSNLRLWALPFCLTSRRLVIPEDATVIESLHGNGPFVQIKG